jgi:hypothetical protein
MTKEEFLKNEILKHSKSVMAFAKEIEVPYTTVKGMLARGINGASAQTVIKVCRGLNVDMESLAAEDYNKAKKSPPSANTGAEELSAGERELIRCFRELNESGKVAARNAVLGFTSIPEYKIHRE